MDSNSSMRSIGNDLAHFTKPSPRAKQDANHFNLSPPKTHVVLEKFGGIMNPHRV